MTPSQFYDIAQSTFTSVLALAGLKSGEYAPAADADRLGNFKEAGRRQALIPEKVLIVYLDKHFASLSNFVSDLASGRSRDRSEPIEGRINDLILYGILLKCLIAERHEAAEVMQQEVKAEARLNWEDEE